MTRPRLKVLALLVGSFALLVIGSVAVAHPDRDRAQISTTHQVDSQIVASFRAFRRPRIQADALPASLTSFSNCGGAGPGNYAFCNVNYARPYVASLTADAANGWQLSIYGQVHTLQVADSRRVPLAGGLGGIYLIPSGRFLCAVFEGPRFHTFFVRMRCGPIGLILRRPPMDFPGYFFGPTAHGIMVAAEPDEVAGAVIAYPGGTETNVLHNGALTACIGQGRYLLEQTTLRDVHLKPVDVGAVGSFKPVTCPALHFSNR